MLNPMNKTVNDDILFSKQIIHEYRTYKKKRRFECFLLFDTKRDCMQAMEDFPYCIYIEMRACELPLLKYYSIPVINSNGKKKNQTPAELLHCLYVEYHASYNKRWLFHDMGVQRLSPYFNLDGCKIREDHTITPCFSSDTVKQKNGNKNGVWIHSHGIGDFFIELPILQNLIENGRIHTFYSLGKPCYLLVKFLFPSIKSYYLNENSGHTNVYQRFIGDVKLLGQYSLNAERPRHDHLLVEKCKKIDFDVSSLLINTRKLLLSSANKNQSLDILRKMHRKLIGVQLISHSTHIIGKSVKCWHTTEVHRFIKMCAEDGIGILSIEKGLEINGQNVYDFSSYTLPQIIGVIANVDLFIGIDSFGCHLAGLMSIKNIRLCGSSLSLMNETMMKNKPLSANIDVIPSEFDLSKITAVRLFQIMKSFLNNKGVKIEYVIS